MQGALDGKPIQAFQNVESLDKAALTKNVKVDTPDNAPEEAGEGPTTIEAKPESAPTVPESNSPGQAPAKAVTPPAKPPVAPSPHG
jgi:hypothetical protein